MGKRDPRVDAYIAKSPEYAKPILVSLRDTVHNACPDVEEDMKWRNPAFMYKGKAVNIQAVGKELGVRYVLEGSVQKAGEQIRIVTQLLDTTTGGHLWAQRYDRPLHDLFALQDEIVQQIVTTLKLQLTLQEQGYVVRKHTDNLEAYDAFLRGVELVWRYSKAFNI